MTLLKVLKVSTIIIKEMYPPPIYASLMLQEISIKTFIKK